MSQTMITPDPTTEEDVYVFPVSAQQRQMWIYDRLTNSLPTYDIAARAWLRGPLDIGVLTAAFNTLVERHEILRTAFDEENGVPVQLISPSLEISIDVIDLRGTPAEHLTARIHKTSESEARHRFDLHKLPLFRVKLLKTKDEEHMLLFTIHHIIADGWSVGIAIHELGALYRDHLAGNDNSLTPLPIQYADYCVWQEDWIKSDDYQNHLDYWKNQLAGAPNGTNLPPDHPIPVHPTHNGAILSDLLPHKVYTKVQAFSRTHGASTYMVLLAAYYVQLHKLTGQTDLVTGAPQANRFSEDVEPLIGYFVNTLPLRVDISGNPTFLQLLERVKDILTETIEHQSVPFDAVVDAVSAKRPGSRNPIFQSLCYYHRDFVATEGQSNLNITSLPSQSPGAAFDTIFYLIERAEGLRLNIDYNTDLYEPKTIKRFLRQYSTILEQATLAPDNHISELSHLTLDEENQLLNLWNNTQREYPRTSSIQDIFETQVEATPDAVALIHGDTHTSYRELNARANQVAGLLQQHGIVARTPVGICMDRSPDLIAGLLGILKTGACYLPIDPTYPKDRIAFMLTDAGVPIVLTQNHLATTFGDSDVTTLSLDEQVDALALQSEANLAPLAAGDSPAYVIYTSGSTGTPKGTTIPHRGVTRLVVNANYVDLSAAETFLQLSSVSFDASTFEIWGALLHGAKLVLVPERLPSLSDIQQALTRNNVSVLWLTSTLFNQIIDHNPESLSGVRQLLVGGEALSVPHIRKALSLLKDTQLINGYGPTEGTTFTCCYPIPAHLPEAIDSIPIGYPISNTQVYILDENRRPVGIDGTGELYIGGDGLSLGYLGREELTAERFVPNPFPDTPGETLYRSGDQCRYLDDGAIEFLGRFDGQVKIRGFRIELGELESVLLDHPTVLQSAAAVHTTEDGSDSLVGYIVCNTAEKDDDQLIGRILEFLRRRLPSYMIPSTLLVLDALPLTTNGKLNRKVLPSPSTSVQTPSGNVALPLAGDEETLSQIWMQILHRDQIDRDGNFFELGGHSLLALQMFDEIEKVTGVALPVATLFEAPTIAQLAARISGTRVQVPSSLPRTLVPMQPNGNKRPLFCIHGGDGGIIFYRDLVSHLPSDQPLYGIEAPWFSNDIDDETTTIESLAANYLDQLRQVQPVGPYQLAGFSLGGVIVYEMAQQLRRNGEEVGSLILFDTFNPARPPRRYTRAERLQRNLSATSNMSFGQRLSRLASRAIGKFRVQQMVRKEDTKAKQAEILKSIGERLDSEQRQIQARRANSQALWHYKPDVYAGRMLLFLATDRVDGYEYAPDLGWHDYVPNGLMIVTIEGAHETILHEPNVQRLAEQLGHHLGNEH